VFLFSFLSPTHLRQYERWRLSFSERDTLVARAATSERPEFRNLATLIRICFCCLGLTFCSYNYRQHHTALQAFLKKTRRAASFGVQYVVLCKAIRVSSETTAGSAKPSGF
jgi:hypothetical protein